MPSIFRGLTCSADIAVPTKLHPTLYVSVFRGCPRCYCGSFPLAPHRGHVPVVVRQNFFKTNTLIVCKPRTDIRIHVSGIVIRVRIRHTAIRIRIVVRPIDHTSPLGKSAFLFHSEFLLMVEGRTTVRPRTPIFASRFARITDLNDCFDCYKC